MKKIVLLLVITSSLLCIQSFKSGGAAPNKLDALSLKVLDTMHTVTIGWAIEKLEKKVPRITKYLGYLKETLEKHNWAELIKVSDKANYAAQKKIGIADHQYVYELFNIDSTYTMEYSTATKGVLESITTFTVHSYNYSNDGGYRSFTFFGEILFSNGKKKSFNLDVTLSKGALWLIGAVG
jgi:hypothetical protein